MKKYVPLALGMLLTTGLAFAAGETTKAVGGAETAAAKTTAAAQDKAAGQDKPAATAVASKELQTEVQQYSYALGLSLGKYFKEMDEKFDLSLIHRGIEDSYDGAKPLISEEEAQKIQQDFAKRQYEKQIQKTVAMNVANRKAADEFLAANKGKAGVKTTASGLQYKVIKEGKGPKPLAEDTVRVHYKGRTLDGTDFDSSDQRNEPAEFQVKQVIPGWREGVQLMPVGSTYEIYLPPDLAYGDQGAPPAIGPGSLIIFQVELLDIVQPQPEGKAEADKADAKAAAGKAEAKPAKKQ